MRPQAYATLAFLLVLLATAPPRPQSAAVAGTAVTMGIAELVDASGLVFEGRVLAAQATEDERGCIQTEYEVLVERTFWGSAADAMFVTLPGGVLPDGRGMLIAGLPLLSVGERTLLFLSEAAPSGLRMPVGLSQGQLRVLDGPGGERILSSALTQSCALTGTGQHVAAPPAEVLDYAAVVAEIRAAAAARSAREAGHGGR